MSFVDNTKNIFVDDRRHNKRTINEVFETRHEHVRFNRRIDL